MEKLKSQVSYWNVNNSESDFIATAFFSNSFTNIIERFYTVSNLLGTRNYHYFINGGKSPFRYKVTFDSNENLDPIDLSGNLHSQYEFPIVLEEFTVSLIDYLSKFLDTMPISNALRLAYAYEHSATMSMLKYQSQLETNIYSDFLKNLQVFFKARVVYYEKLLRLDKYDQFVHVKNSKNIDGVKLCNVNTKQFEEIVAFYSNLVAYGGLGEIRFSLSSIFDGKPNIDFLVLHGQKNQLADSFFQVYKNDKVDVENATVYKDWVNARFRVMVKGKVEFLKPTLTEIFKSKNKPTKNKRLTLPDFLTYFK